jgi:methionyl-tRNA formyltransferase
MKILFVGTVLFSEMVLQELIRLGADITGVITKEKSDFNADFRDLSHLCKQHSIPWIYSNNINGEDTLEWIRGRKPDIGFCFGWSQIIKKQVLDIPPGGIIGYHPAELPLNRGRHPLIWALFLGLEQTASTFFRMDEGADSGDIISQEKVKIHTEDTAHSLYKRIIETAREQIADFLPKLQDNTLSGIQQDHNMANYWRKRGIADGKIDFRMSTKAVYNLVRALTRPYIGAHIVHGETDVKIWEVKPQEVSLPNIEPGKVLDVGPGKEILVKTYDGAVLITDHDFKRIPEKGEYL